MKVVEMRTDASGCGSVSADGLRPGTDYIGALWPLPDGYRLITKEDRKKYRKHDLWDYLMYSNDGGESFHTLPTANDGWAYSLIYVIRKDWTPADLEGEDK